MSVGYSGSPLSKKLGLNDRSRLLTINEPPEYLALLGEPPAGLCRDARLTKATTTIHLFVTTRAELADRLKSLRHAMRPDAAAWVSWPKKSSKVPTDVTEDTIRQVALPLGLVDIKVCAVNEVWSGLKLVIRKELRG